MKEALIRHNDLYHLNKLVSVIRGPGFEDVFCYDCSPAKRDGQQRLEVAHAPN